MTVRQLKKMGYKPGATVRWYDDPGYRYILTGDPVREEGLIICKAEALPTRIHKTEICIVQKSGEVTFILETEAPESPVNNK